jgi:hypothetical protein
MTILNFWCTEDRAVVAVDTVTAWSGDGSRAGEASKLVVLPGLRLVVASRGLVPALNILAREVLRLDLDFDKLQARMRTTLPKILQQFSLAEDASRKWEVAVVGWSAARNRMDAALWDADRAQCFPRQGMQHAIAPRIDDSAELVADPFSKDAMITTMRRQLAWSKTGKEPGGFGGRMVYVDMHRDGMSVDWSCPLE